MRAFLYVLLLLLELVTVASAQEDATTTAAATTGNNDGTTTAAAETTAEATTTAAPTTASDTTASEESSITSESVSNTESAAYTTAAATTTDDAWSKTSAATTARSSATTTLGNTANSVRSLADLPTLAGAGIPTVTVPDLSRAPFMQKSPYPEGTVFICVGATLGVLGFCILAWRAMIAYSLRRSVKKAALAQSMSDSSLRSCSRENANKSKPDVMRVSRAALY